MGEKPKRPRIPKIIPAGTGIVKDELEFVKNLCTIHGRYKENAFKGIDFKIWVDKHYKYREQFGDEDGPREGIVEECVISLVKESLPHLLFYCSQITGFTFVTNKDNCGRATRIVLQKEEKGVMLNVVIETHYHTINDFEITVITAKKINGFRLSDGQYAIELKEDGSVLRRLIKGNIQEISDI